MSLPVVIVALVIVTAVLDVGMMRSCGGLSDESSPDTIRFWRFEMSWEARMLVGIVSFILTPLAYPALAQSGTVPGPRCSSTAPRAVECDHDVAGVEVGHATLISGEGGWWWDRVLSALVRSCSTRPRFDGSCFRCVVSLNGNGEMTGTGGSRVRFSRAVSITNLMRGVVRDAVI